MPATYGNFRVEVEGVLTPTSDFRIGSAEQTSMYSDLPVLRWDKASGGTPFLPGSSLRGVVRAYLLRECSLLGCSKETLDSLFGSAVEEGSGSFQGRLRVLDAIANIPSRFEIRDHVRIHRDHGAAEETAKFDAEVVRANPSLRFPFRVIYEGEKADDDELILLGAAVKALENEEIAIGSRSGIGFGRFKLELTCRRSYDRSRPDELLSYLLFRSDLQYAAPQNFSFPASKPAIQPSIGLQPLHRLTFSLTLRCNGPLLIQAAALPSPDRTDNDDDDREASAEPKKLDKRYLRHSKEPNQTAEDIPVIPGASLRGVLRTRAELIANSQRLEASIPNRLFGNAKGGESGRRGLLRVTDGVVADPPVTSATEAIAASENRVIHSDHVAVDRITQAAAAKKKFETEALNSPQIVLQLHSDFTDDFEDLASVALLLAVLKGLQRNSPGFAFGSQTTRGYGTVESALISGVRGSFHGDLAKKLPYLEGAGAAPLGRTSFGRAGDAAQPRFEDLCAIFDPYWKQTRLRAITS